MSIPTSTTALIVLLEHSSNCNDAHCSRANECREMKQLIHHLLLCKQPSCKICLEVSGYIQVHSSTCNAPTCPVMTCCALRQYAVDKERKNSTLTSYSSDLSALENLKVKSKTSCMQPKIRGTYQCGRCGMPKIRPHKCADSADCSSRELGLSIPEQDEDSQAMEALIMPKPSAEPSTGTDTSAGEFSFCSRRKAAVSRSFSFDRVDTQKPTVVRMAVSLDEEELQKARSASVSEPHFLHSEAASLSMLRPPVSPLPLGVSSTARLSMPGASISTSIELPVRTSRSSSYDSQDSNHKAISLVKKPTEGSLLHSKMPEEEPAVQRCVSSIPPYGQSAPLPLPRTLPVDDSEGSTCSSTGSHSRKRLVPDTVLEQLSRKRFEAAPDRPIVTPVFARQMTYNPQYPYPQGPQSASLLRRTPSSYSCHSSASELSDECSTSSSIEDLDTADDAVPATQGYPGGYYEYPPNFPPPLLQRQFTSWMHPQMDFPPCPMPPPGAQLVTCYAQTDAFGRTVMVPCWGNPYPSTAGSTSSAAELSGSGNGRGGGAKKGRAKGKTKASRDATDDTSNAASTTGTATSSSVECSVVSPAKATQSKAAAKRGSRKLAANPTPANTSSSAGVPTTTMATVEMSAELDVDLDAFALDLAGSFITGAHTDTNTGAAGLDFRPYSDEDEEDLFKYLSEEMVCAY